MKKILILLVIASAVGAWWYYDLEDQLTTVKGYIENGEVMTLEARYTPDQIMDTNRKSLLTDNQKTYKDSLLKFYPYLLMDVKYTDRNRTKESQILWSQVDGEMVLNTDTWDQTHGFADAIDAGADRNDFRLLQVLSGGSLTKDKLRKELHLEEETLDKWLDRAKSKHLIVQSGNEFQLHFENPKLNVVPQTAFRHELVTKPYDHAQRMGKRYSKGQIEKIAQASYGNDFKIKSVKEVYLPVYSIQVQNPDGSLLTSNWNALNGKRVR